MRKTLVRIGRKDGQVRSKRQQTMAKLTRERMVKERRTRKQEKKAAAAAERIAKEAEGTLSADTVEDESGAGDVASSPAQPAPGS